MILQRYREQESNWTLYRHTSPSGKVYIGITSQNPYYRWNNGKGYLNAAMSIFKNTIMKYGWDNIKHEILFTNLEESRAKRLEIELIRHYKSLGISLNCTNGGEGTKGVTPWNKGKKLPYNQTNKLRGKPLSEEHKSKLRKPHRGNARWRKGVHLTSAQIESLRRANIGRVKSKEERLKISKNSPYSKVVLQYKDDTLIGRYKSGAEAGRVLNIDYSSILKCCRGKQKTCKGFVFIFENNNGESYRV